VERGRDSRKERVIEGEREKERFKERKRGIVEEIVSAWREAGERQERERE